MNVYYYKNPCFTVNNRFGKIFRKKDFKKDKMEI